MRAVERRPIKQRGEDTQSFVCRVFAIYMSGIAVNFEFIHSTRSVFPLLSGRYSMEVQVASVQIVTFRTE